MKCAMIGPPVQGCPCQFCRDLRPPKQPKPDEVSSGKKQRPIMVRQGQIVR